MKLFRTVLTVILSNSVLVKGHPRPEVSEVSEAMINDVLKSIRKVMTEVRAGGSEVVGCMVGYYIKKEPYNLPSF